MSSLSQYKNYAIALEYIKSDYYRYYGNVNVLKLFIKALIGINHCFTYSFWFRLAKVKGVLYPLCKIMHYRLSRKYGIQIPIPTKIGFGFYIGHGVGIIINSTATIGNNVNISQFTTIGAHGMAAKIGNNVYIGPSVCIVNDVIIKDNVAIGAGAVVIKDVEANMTVGGVPAKVLNTNGSHRYINKKYKINDKLSI